MKKKLLNFTNATIANVEYLNPLFSTCSIKVMYHGENRNMTTISKEVVEKALPSIFGIPIVGEYEAETEDYKGHGGEIDLETMSIRKTTRPYGYVPDDATYRWEEANIIGSNKKVEYLVLDGCRLWTGNYPEAYEMLKGKGQSMEIIVEDGEWNDSTESYEINDFLFSALCVLGDTVEPCFEGANIATSYSKDSTFQQEYRKMLEDAKATLYSKEENNLKLKELLTKYSTTAKDLTEKGLVFEDVAEENLEAEIAKTLGVEVIVDGENQEDTQEDTDKETDEFAKGKKKDDDDEKSDNEADDADDDAEDSDNENDKEDEDEEDDKKNKKFEEDSKSDWISPEALEEIKKDYEEKFEKLKADYDKLSTESAKKDEQLSELSEFKLQIEKTSHEEKANELFADFQLSEEDVQDLDVHEFSIEELEGKCYEIFGRKMKGKKTYTRQSSTKTSILDGKKETKEKSSIDILMEKYGKKK